MFASKALGEGIAVYPNEGKLYAPVNGEVTTLFPTNHAIGIISDEGIEILLHIGIDTVTMDGNGFQSYIKVGQRVKVGQLLIEFDIKKIESYELSACVMIIVTNHSEVGTLVVEEQGNTDSLQKIISVR